MKKLKSIGKEWPETMSKKERVYYTFLKLFPDKPELIFKYFKHHGMQITEQERKQLQQNESMFFENC
jgi:hypothetical protein